MGDRVIDAVARVQQLSADRSKKSIHSRLSFSRMTGFPDFNARAISDAVPEPP